MDRNRVDTEKYVLAYRICQIEVSNDFLVPELEENQIIKYISNANWLLFPIKTETSKEDAKDDSRPNVYIRVMENDFEMGLTLNQIKAVEWFLNIDEAHSQARKKELVSMLAKLPDGFKTRVNRKIKDKNHAQVPVYECEFEFQSNKITENELQKMVEKSRQIREEGNLKRKEREGKYYSELPEINLCSIKQQSFNEENIRTAAKNTFPILQICLSIETRTDNESEQIYKEILADKMLRQFKNNKREYYETFVERKYPNTGFGKFRQLFNKAIKEKE